MTAMRRTRPSFSVVIPVLGEAAGIDAVVDHARVVGYGQDVEVVVVGGGPGGGGRAAVERGGG